MLLDRFPFTMQSLFAKDHIRTHVLIPDWEGRGEGEALLPTYLLEGMPRYGVFYLIGICCM